MLPLPPDELGEKQQQEEEALRSIYGDDFLATPPNQPKAWGRASTLGGGEFGIRLSGKHSDVEEGSDRTVQVVLVVKYSKSYPNVSPMLSFTSAKNVSPAQLNTLTKLVLARARELLGSEVVFDIAGLVEDWLTAECQPPPAPASQVKLDAKAESLLVEMAKREKEAKAAAIASAQRKEENLAQQAHQRALLLSRQVSEHKRLQSTRQAEIAAATRAAASAQNGPPGPSEWAEITFGRPSGEHGEECSAGREGCFRIFGGVKEKLWSTYIAIPSDPSMSSSVSSADGFDFSVGGSSLDNNTFSISIIDFPTPYYSSPQGLQKLRSLFETLRGKVLSLSTEQVVPLYSVKLCERGLGRKGRRLCLLTGRVGRGERLRSVLKVSGRLEMGLAKDHLVQVLAGLEAIRKEGITHDDVSLDTVILSSSSGGARLAEPCYRKRVIDMDRSNPFLDEVAMSAPPEIEIGDEGEAEPLPWNWRPPEEVTSSHSFSHKRDIWHTGLTFIRMLWGANVIQAYNTLDEVLQAEEFYVPEPLAFALKKMMAPLARDRWTAEEAVTQLSTMDLTARAGPSSSFRDTSGKTILKALSPGVNMGPTRGFFDRPPGPQHIPYNSRYLTDFEEVEKLGQGGFGEVFKARNRLDGRFYAIKKIKLRQEDNEQKVFREVNALSRLNHQFIVRYFTCWLESIDPTPPHPNVNPHPATSLSSSVSSLRDPTRSPTPNSDGGFDDAMFQPNFDDDFLSVRGRQSRSTSFPTIHFGGDDDDDDDDDDDNESKCDDSAGESESTISDDTEDTSSEKPPPPRGRSRPPKNAAQARQKKAKGLFSPSFTDASTDSVPTQASRTLYIQMEYVENQTLKEAIARGLSDDECWRLFRQILEALTHMANLGIVHRDLKPSNLLIDRENCIKIGDFGLAATDFAQNEASMEHAPLRAASDAADLTSGIGTSLYIAPEVEATSRGGSGSTSYNDLADMYSLGIIFFEMNYPVGTLMERAFVIRDLRSRNINFPSGWPRAQKPQQTKIIESLLQHEPSGRPKAITLLTNGLLPSVKEDEYFHEALRTFGNPSSTRYPVLLNHIFHEPRDSVSDYTFDDPDSNPQEHRVYEALVRDRLVDLFRRHGAIDWEPPLLLPVSELLNFRKEPGARFLNSQGQLVELPYDGLVSFARHVARTQRERLKRYHVGASFRENPAGGQPLSFGEVAYDILSPVRSMASEAELISVLDRVLDCFPGLREREWEFRISHSSVFDLVMQNIPSKRRAEVSDVLRELGGKVGFIQIKQRMSGMGLTKQAIDGLQKWCVVDSVDAVIEHVSHRFPSLSSPLRKATKEVKEVIRLAEKLGVRRRIVFQPTMNHRFFQGGCLFELVRASQKREVLSVGGRYDNLVEHFRLPQTNNSVAPSSNLVGMQISLERIVYLVGKAESAKGKRLISLENEELRSYGWTPKRCDVYVGSFNEGFMEDRVEVIGEIWGAGISADVMYDDAVGILPEEVMAECLQQGILFLVVTKGRPVLKVRSVLRRTEEDVYREDLVAFLRENIENQRRVDLISAPGPANMTAAPVDNHSRASHGGTGGALDLIRLILPADVHKNVNGGSMSAKSHNPKKLHRHANKALFFEKARNFLTVTKSPLPLFVLDLSSSVLSMMSLDPSWLSLSEEHADLWKAIRDRCPPGYAALIRDEIRECWESEESLGAIWLFGIREERGFLVQLGAAGPGKH